jgi:hypothetical protein
MIVSSAQKVARSDRICTQLVIMRVGAGWGLA